MGTPKPTNNKLISISIPPTPDLGETKLVTIVPRFVLVNNTKSKHKLYIGQYDRQEHYKMHHGHTGLEFENQKPFHWSDRRETKKITVMIEDLEANGDNGTNTWSAPFQIEEIGQMQTSVVLATKKSSPIAPLDYKSEIRLEG